MKEKKFKYLSCNNKDIIAGIKYMPDNGNIQGIIQIVHGMSEHIGRYKDFIEYIVSKGYIVCGNDHIGHGLSAKNNNYGYMANSKMYDTMVGDMYKLTAIMKKEFLDYKYILFGHSMGSFLSRYYIIKFKDVVDGLILSGTGGTLKYNSFAIFLSEIFIKLKGSEAEGKLFQKLTNKIYNNRFRPVLSNFDWLSNDRNKINDFIKDKKCGFTFTYLGYNELFKLIKIVSNKIWYKSVNNNLPIFIFSGINDPVGDYGRGVKEVYNKLLKYGCINVKIKLYNNGRHEMINDLNRGEVFYDIYNWLKLLN